MSRLFRSIKVRHPRSSGGCLRSWSPAVLLALTVGVGSLPTFAQQPSSDPAADEARKYYQQGAAAAKKQDWSAAYEAFAKAWKYKKHWQISANLGRAAHELKRHRRAAEHLSIFLRETEPDIPAAEKARAGAWLTEARKHVGSLTIAVQEANKEVLVDASPVGQSPLPGEVFVDPGTHEISVTLTGCIASAKIDVGAGESRSVSLHCAGTPETPPSATTAPTAPPEPTATASATAAPTAPATQAPSIVPVLPTATASESPKTSVPRLPVVVAGAGLAAVGIVVGAVGISVAGDRLGEYRALAAEVTARGSYTPDELARARQLSSDHATFGNMGVGAFIGAGVLAAGTVVFVVLTRPRDEKKVGAASLQLTPSGKGAVLSGTF